jgi:LuxR family maltose regulon positive regulatory protein
LQRLRLEDRLELVSHRDLAFTAEETAAAVSAMHVDLSPDEIGNLHRVTQGWPAAVRMALLAMTVGGQRGLALDLRRDDALADYLTTEVLAAVDPELRPFLVSATVDELVCASLVDSVLQTRSGAHLLERCTAEGLFLTREERPGDEPWYHWHSLFAAHMRDRRRAENPVEARELELRAATWWSTVDPVTAVGHALEAGDPEGAASIVASSWPSIALEGRADTVVSLIGSIPPGAADEAELHLALAFIAAQSAHPETARVELSQARHQTERLDVAARSRFETRATVIDLFLVNDRAALTDAVRTGEALLRDAGDGPWSPDHATLALVKLYVGMGQARLQDDLPRALRLLRDAAETARASGLPALELAALAETCVPSIAEGDLEGTRQTAVGVLATARSRGWAELRSLAPAHCYLGWLALWQGDAHQARDRLELGLSLLLPTDWGMRGLTLTTLAQACLLAGEVAEAEAAAHQAHDLASSGRMPRWWPSLLHALDATLAMANGDLAEAVERAGGPDPGPGYNLADCLRARILLRGGRPQACLDLVRGIPLERRFAHVGVLIEVLGAHALGDLARASEAQAALERALAAATPAQLVTPFLVAGPGLVPLLQERLRQGTAYPEFVPQILHRIAAGTEGTVNEWGETLTDREHVILRYLATNLSNSEIARTEFVSVNTTKTHIAHIYRKLGVSSRREAVRRAGELGLI